MWKDLPKLKNPASFLPWLRQIARNRLHHVLRSRVRARRHESADEALVQTVADARPGAETALLAEEDRRLVADALDRLPDDSREVLLLFYREEQSVRQVATLLDLSEDAVKQRLSRARAVLRRDLLASVGTTLRRTAPGASFTAAVALTISAGAPPAGAAAATLAAQSAAKGGLLAKIAVVFSWGVIGPLASIATGVQGGRMAARGALDEEERSAWRLHTWTNAVLTSTSGARSPSGGRCSCGHGAMSVR
jgi:RNA polymerase sigma factor (sigma-70 family)